MERGRLSPRTCTPSPGQCSMCQRHLWQWRADGGLAHQRPDIPRTADARTGHSYPRGTQRQRWPSGDLRSNRIARARLIMPSLMQRLGKSRTIALGSLCTAAGLVLIPLGPFLWSRLALPAPGVLFYVGSVTFVLGIALDMVNIPAQTVMQQQTPEGERGRVFSFQSMQFKAGSLPVLLFAGVIADTLGSRPSCMC